MAHERESHTQTEQNTSPLRTDLETNEEQQTSDATEDAGLYRDSENVQMGGNRSPQNTRSSSNNRNTEDAAVAREGSVTTRTPGGKNQGISSHSADEEAARQRKVVKDRQDAQAGVNHNTR